MKVLVRYMAHLKQAAGVGVEEIELEQSSSATDVVRNVAARHGEALRQLLLDEHGQLQPMILLFVNDEQVVPGQEVQLGAGDEVSFLAPIAGG